LSRATYLVSIGNNIDSLTWRVTYNDFARFACNDVKDRQVARDNTIFTYKTWWPNFVVPYTTDNRSANLQYSACTANI